MARGDPPSQELFPGEPLDGRPAFWKDLERRRNRLKKAVQGANAQLLCAGWRLGRDGVWWVARHPVMGFEVRSMYLGKVVQKALHFEVPEETQLELL